MLTMRAACFSDRRPLCRRGTGKSSRAVRGGGFPCGGTSMRIEKEDEVVVCDIFNTAHSDSGDRPCAIWRRIAACVCPATGGFGDLSFR